MLGFFSSKTQLHEFKLGGSPELGLAKKKKKGREVLNLLTPESNLGKEEHTDRQKPMDMDKIEFSMNLRLHENKERSNQLVRRK